MVKYRKFFLGAAISLVTGLIGPIIWVINQDSVRMARDLKSFFTPALAAAFIPAIIIYFLWYHRGVKVLESAKGKIPSALPFAIIGVILILAVTLGLGLTIFIKGSTYALITAVIAGIGTAVSYAIGH